MVCRLPRKPGQSGFVQPAVTAVFSCVLPDLPGRVLRGRSTALAPVDRTEALVADIAVEKARRRSLLRSVTQEGVGRIAKVPQVLDGDGVLLVNGYGERYVGAGD